MCTKQMFIMSFVKIIGLYIKLSFLFHILFQCEYMKKTLHYECFFLAAAADQGHVGTGSAVGLQYLQKNQREIIRNFQYQVGQSGM